MVDQIQKCDENDAADNNAECTNRSSTIFDTLDVSGNYNNINYDIDTKQINDCDDNTDADNILKCNNFLP